MSISIETALFNALKAAIEAAEEDDPLFEVELKSSIYDPFSETKVIRIGDSNADLAPESGGAVQEFDVLGQVEILAKPGGDSPDDYNDAREMVRLMTIAVAQVLVDDPTLNGGVHDSRILGGVRAWGNYKGQRHAAAKLNLIANETGAVE